MSRANAWLSIELNGPSFPEVSSSKRHSQALKKHDFRALHKVNVPIVRSPVFFGGDSPGIFGGLFHTVGMFLSFIVTCAPKKTMCPNRSPHRSSIFWEIRRFSYLLDPSWKTIAIVPILESLQKAVIQGRHLPKPTFHLPWLQNSWKSRGLLQCPTRTAHPWSVLRL